MTPFFVYSTHLKVSSYQNKQIKTASLSTEEEEDNEDDDKEEKEKTRCFKIYVNI